MAGDSSLALQTSIYTALKGDAALMALVTDVFDYVPEEAKTPYVTIGEETAADWTSSLHKGTDATINIHSWSHADGRAEVKQIMGAIYDILHEGKIPIPGYTLVSMRFEFQETLLDEDGKHYHGIQRFRVLTHA